MRIVAIADLQGQCKKIKPDMLPKGEILLIAGDLGGWGTIQEMEEINEWLGALPYTTRILIGGNHDFALEIFKGGGKNLFSNAIYLENEGIEIKGMKIWGSPVSYNNPQEVPYFRAFAEYEQKQCDLIPKGLDILLIHGPAYGILDKGDNAKHLGSKIILDAVRQAKPKFMVHGHIHSAYGRGTIGETVVLNAALPDDRNTLFDKKGKLLHDPIIIDI